MINVFGVGLSGSDCHADTNSVTVCPLNGSGTKKWSNTGTTNSRNTLFWVTGWRKAQKWVVGGRQHE